MKVWLFTHNFPPEVNAVANRSYEHARQWVIDGAEIDVITDVPHFPEGRVYQGYNNRVTREEVDGIRVMRVPSYIAANQGRIRRVLGWVSFMVSAVLFSRKIERKPDVVLGTSPHIFTAMAALVVSRLHRVPFVLEVRDLWPQSIRAVGAIKMGFIITCVQYVVDYLYRSAAKVVVVSQAFREEIETSGVPAEKIVYVPNGFPLEALEEVSRGQELKELRKILQLENRFVVSYIGTVGMAHCLETVIEAARMCEDEKTLFVIAGAGANWTSLERQAEGVSNLKLVPKLPRSQALALLRVSDVSLIHLKDTPVFRTVLPSKMFEAMALSKPIILGVKGEAERLLIEADAGVAIEPESPEAIVEAVRQLKDARIDCLDKGQNGYNYFLKNHDRSVLARRLFQELETVRGASVEATELREEDRENVGEDASEESASEVMAI